MNDKTMSKLLRWVLAPALLAVALFFSLANTASIQSNVLVTIKGTGLVFPATVIFGTIAVVALFGCLVVYEVGRRLHHGEDI